MYVSGTVEIKKKKNREDSASHTSQVFLLLILVYFQYMLNNSIIAMINALNCVYYMYFLGML